MRSIQKNLSNAFYALLSLPCTAMGFALSVQIAALSWILSTKYGFDMHDVGFVWAAGPLAGIIGQPIVGLLSDKVWFWKGRRRPFILIGGTIAALMLLALPFIDVIGAATGIESLVTIALIVALTLDLSINISFNPTRAIIADVTPAGDQRTKGYTWMQTISGFFGVSAYLISIFWGNLTLIYFGSIIVLIFSVIPTFFIEEPKTLDVVNDVKEDDSVLETNLPEFLKISFAHAFTWLGVQTMFVYIFFYLKEVIFGYAPDAVLDETVSNEIGRSIGIAFAVLNTVGFVLPALVLEPITKKIGRVRTHAICILIMAIGYGLLSFLTPSLTTLYFLMAIVGIGWAAVVSLPFAIMSEVVDERKMGLFMGLFNLSVVLPQLVASSIGGWIQTFANKNIIFTVCAISLLVSALLWFMIKESNRGESKTTVPTGGH